MTDRAQRGDADALRELRQAMTTDPWLERRLSDFARFTREHMVRLSLSAKDLLARDVLDRQLAALRQELEASVQSPLERLLVERILTCWIAVQLAEVAAADPTILTDDPATQRLDRAHRRYLTAIQALARVSQLLAPIIAQVNIAAPGAQQLNLAAPHLATSISSPPPTLTPAPTLTPNPTKPA